MEQLKSYVFEYDMLVDHLIMKVSVLFAHLLNTPGIIYSILYLRKIITQTRLESVFFSQRERT